MHNEMAAWFRHCIVDYSCDQMMFPIANFPNDMFR